MFNFFFDEIVAIISDVVLAIYLFFGGIVYGEVPDFDFECVAPSTVYEYESGDTVELEITSENVGRPVEYTIGYNQPRIMIYVKNDSHYYLYDNRYHGNIGVDGAYIKLFEHGYEETNNISFTIPEDAPEGEYSVYVRLNSWEEDKQEEVFTDLITVK